MNNAMLDNHRIAAATITRSADHAAPVRNGSDDSDLRAELDRQCAENHRLRVENRRLQRTLDDRTFRAALEAKPRLAREITAGTSEGPLRR